MSFGMPDTVTVSIESTSNQFLFQNMINAINQGEILDVGTNKFLTVCIYGSATARTVQFFSINPIGELIALLGYNTSTGDTATFTDGITSETWQFDITGLDKIVMKISTISGGSLTVSGTVVV